MTKLKVAKKLPFILLIIIILVLATATVVEKIFGAAVAHEHIYGAWWFVALWSAMTLSTTVFFIKARRSLPLQTLIIHISLIIILSGAFITFAFAERGYIHIRQGETLSHYISEENDEQKPLPFNIKLVLFDIEYHTESERAADFISFVQINGEMCRISMNKIRSERGFRLYQMSYDSDEMGVTLLVNHDVWGIAVTYTGYFLLLISALWLLWRKLKWKKFLYIAVPAAALWFFISQIKPMTPVLRSPMLAAHVSVIMVAYVLLLIITILSIIALIKDKGQNNNSQLLFPAVFLLAIGIFIGAMWANISWGRYWGWDAKETWALITLLVYAIPLHKKTFPKFQNPIFFHKYLIIAFISVLMTFLGVSFLLGGMHSYL